MRPGWICALAQTTPPCFAILSKRHSIVLSSRASLRAALAVGLLAGIGYPCVDLALDCRVPMSEACVWGKAFLPLTLGLSFVFMGDVDRLQRRRRASCSRKGVNSHVRRPDPTSFSRRLRMRLAALRVRHGTGCDVQLPLQGLPVRKRRNLRFCCPRSRSRSSAAPRRSEVPPGHWRVRSLDRSGFLRGLRHAALCKGRSSSRLHLHQTWEPRRSILVQADHRHMGAACTSLASPGSRSAKGSQDPECHPRAAQESRCLTLPSGGRRGAAPQQPLKRELGSLDRTACCATSSTPSPPAATSPPRFSRTP